MSSCFAEANKLLREGKVEAAIAAYKNSTEESSFHWLHHNLGESFEKVGKINEAEAAFRQALVINPQSAFTIYKLGVVLSKQGKFQEAVDYLRQAVELIKDVPKVDLNLGIALVKLEKWSEAEKYLQEVIEFCSKSLPIPQEEVRGKAIVNFYASEAYYYLGQSKSKQEKWSEAVELYEQSWRLNEGQINCCLSWANALGKLGRWLEVVDLYNQNLFLFDDSSEVVFLLGQALGQLQRWEEAVVEYQRAIDLGFDGAEIRHHLGYALEQLGRWEEAVVELRLVVEVNPRSAQVRHQLGYALGQLERWGEAEIELRKSVELYPESAVVWQQLGDVLEKLGERDEAVEAYQRALELKSGEAGEASNWQCKKNSILKVNRNKRPTSLNVLFVLYGDIDCNGGYHAQLHATRLLAQGVDCLFAVPDSSNDVDMLRQTLRSMSKPFLVWPFSRLLSPHTRLPFADGRSPDIIHAWTPREVVRKCVERLLKQYSCPLVIHLEDNEEYVTEAKVGRPFVELAKLPEVELDKLIPLERYHPIKGKAFLNQAQGLTMIIQTLKVFNTGKVAELVLAPPADESLFYPRPLNLDLRRSLGIPETHVVLAYTGNVHSANQHEVRELYQAVKILNQQGCPTVLLRTGLNPEELGVESWGGVYEKYLGWVERDQVPEILAAADILVQPGVPGVFNDQRVPSKLLEYFAMGRPVVLPKTNLGLRVKHGQEGYVLEKSDAQGIAGAIQRIKADRELARQLSDGAVEFYLSQLEQELMGTKLNDYYRSLKEGRLTETVSSLAIQGSRDEKRQGETFFVVTPCLNAVATIDYTIESVISQSGDFWIRYHVQDGGSTDLTLERLQYWETVISKRSPYVQCRGVEFSWASQPDEGMYDAVMKGFDSFEMAPREFMTWINADDALMPGALSAICQIVQEHPGIEWIGGPQYVFKTDIQQRVLQRGTPTPTAVIRAGLCDGQHWEMLQQEGTFFSKALWFKSKHGLRGFALAGDWNLWREMAHHGLYYQYHSPLGAFRKRPSQLSVERIGDYRAEIDQAVPLEVRKAAFKQLYQEQQWEGNLIKPDGASGAMMLDTESVQEVYEKIRGVKEVNLISESQTETDSWFHQARKLHQEEKLMEAVGADRSAIAQNQNLAQAHYNLGQALAQLERWDEAVLEYQRAISFGFSRAEVRHHLGYALMKLECWIEAEVELRKAVELHPGSAMVWQHLGDVLQELGQRNEAVEIYRQALEIEPKSVEILEHLGNTLHQLGFLDEAIAAFRRAVWIKPNLVRVHDKLAAIFCKKGQQDQAEIWKRLGQGLKSYSPTLEELIQQQKQLEEAVGVETIDVQVNSDDPWEIPQKLADILRDRGELDKAVDAYRYAIDVNPSNSQSYQNLGAVLKQQGKHKEAVIVYSQGVKLNQNHFKVSQNQRDSTDIPIKQKLDCQRKIRRVAVIGNYLPRKCGIATFTTDLCNALSKECEDLTVLALAVNDHERGYDYPSMVAFEIQQYSITSYRRAADFINQNDIDVVCLQHEYGIFGGSTGCHILTLLERLRMPVLATLHTILKNPNEEQNLVIQELGNICEKLVVMTERGKVFLQEVFGIPKSKIEMISHGVHDVPFTDSSTYKDKFSLGGKNVILTFGLLGHNKGIEYVIQAMPKVIEQFPNTVYLCVGATHPHLVEHEGEIYRESLVKLADELGVAKNIIFVNQFLELDELIEYIGAADIYITPYLSKSQITSGTLAYAVSAGKAVISTPYWHAEELLADDRGILVPFRDPEAIASEILNLLKNPQELNAIQKRAYVYGRDLTWFAVAKRYMETFVNACYFQ